MTYTHQEIEEMKSKADKWDSLEQSVAKFFISGENDGDEIDNDVLIKIGELAVGHLGFQ
mgnify:CR=1 FL=1